MPHRSTVYVVFLLCIIWPFGIVADTTPAATGGAAIRTPIKIGALMPLSGEFAMPASAFREGMELALEILNEEGGVQGRPLQLVIEDTRSNPKTISAAAGKLASVDRVIAAITTSYPETEIGGGIFQRSGIPSLALWDSSPHIDAMGEYIFAIGPWTPSDADVSASFARDALSAQKAVVMTTVEHWSELVGDLFEKEFVRRGGQILARLKQNPGDTDFRTHFTRIRALQPDAIYAPLASEIIPFHKQRQSAAIMTPVISSAIITDEHIAREQAIFEGVYQSQIGDPKRPETFKLIERYRKKFGKAPSMTWFVATGHDAVQLFAEGIRTVGTDSQKLKDYLYTVKNYPGAAQEISISAGGSSPYFVKMFRIRSGKFELIE